MSLTIIHGGFVALSRTKPAMEEGHRLLEVKVRRRRAIDIPATLDTLAGMNVVGRMHDFVGLDLLLPEADLDKAVVEREIEGAHEVWETALPAVISAQKGLNEPRYASLKGIMAAKKKTIEAKDASALGLKAEDLQPRTQVVAFEPPPARPGVRMITGDPDAQVKELVRVLHEEAKVL